MGNVQVLRRMETVDHKSAGHGHQKNQAGYRHGHQVGFVPGPRFSGQVGQAAIEPLPDLADIRVVTIDVGCGNGCSQRLEVIIEVDDVVVDGGDSRKIEVGILNLDGQAVDVPLAKHVDFDVLG